MTNVKNYEQLNTRVNAIQGEVLMVSARQTKTSDTKFVIEFAQRVVSPESINILGVLNAADERFSGGPGVRRAWQTVEAENFKEQFGIDLIESFSDDANLIEDNQDRKVLPILEANPTIEYAGIKVPVFLNIKETVVAPNDWALQNPEKAVKQNGEGLYCFKNGMPIYATMVLSTSKTKHQLIQHDEMKPLARPDVTLATSDEFEGVEEDSAILAGAEG